MTASIVTTPFQNIDKAFEIRVDVSVRMIDRIAHPGLGREVNDLGKAMFCKQRRDRGTIRQIGLHEAEMRMLAQDIQPRLLQRRVIVTVEIVKTDNWGASGEQLMGDVKPNKPRRTRDQYC